MNSEVRIQIQYLHISERTERWILGHSNIYISRKQRKDEFWDKDTNSIFTHLKSNSVLFISQLLNVTLSVIFSLNSWWENMCFSRCLPICCWIGYIWMRVAAFLLLKITSLSPFLLSFQLEIGEMAIKLVLLLLSSLLNGEHWASWVWNKI